jgi:Calcineurin-like phosphoesterase
MKRLLQSIPLLVAATFAAHSAIANEGRHDDDKITIAVFGDWPYNDLLLNNAPLLINSVNADRDVSLVIHVGDIHSGSQPCTSASILPPIAKSNPGWNQAVYAAFQKFKSPVVYTPGDNEWTDCHKAKESQSGDALKELPSVRSLFFAKPGRTLGLEEKKVWSQAKHFDQNFPADAQFVENVIWEDGKTVFVTLNVPGSNDDTVPWTAPFNNPAAQAKEIAERDAANIRWLNAAFNLATNDRARAVVIALQADMWDPAALVSGADGLNAYTPFVQELARLTIRFGRPVLLLNGDSHLYESDHPLADPASATGLIHKTPAAPNLTRITVQGSTNAPAEWLRLTIDTRSHNIFTWRNVPYCVNPLTSCQ